LKFNGRSLKFNGRSLKFNGRSLMERQRCQSRFLENCRDPRPTWVGIAPQYGQGLFPHMGEVCRPLWLGCWMRVFWEKRPMGLLVFTSLGGFYEQKTYLYSGFSRFGLAVYQLRQQ